MQYLGPKTLPERRSAHVTAGFVEDAWRSALGGKSPQEGAGVTVKGNCAMTWCEEIMYDPLKLSATELRSNCDVGELGRSVPWTDGFSQVAGAQAS